MLEVVYPTFDVAISFVHTALLSFVYVCTRLFATLEALVAIDRACVALFDDVYETFDDVYTDVHMALESETKLLESVLTEFDVVTDRLLAKIAASNAYVDVLTAYELELNAAVDVFDAYDDVSDDAVFDPIDDERF